MDNLLSEFDKIYELYGYIAREIKGVRVYEYKHGRYFGADILRLGNESENAVNSIEKEYKDQDFATSIKKYNSIQELETDLFKSFFQIRSYKNSLKRNYESFVSKQLLSLPEGSKYEYIVGNYTSNLYNHYGSAFDFEQQTLPDSPISNVINTIKENENIPLLTIIEAAAGYGKTCTAYEIVNKLCEFQDEKIPLYIELAKNRSARIFKHVLQKEVEEQFQGSTSEIVMHQIIEGRIPVVIDGFDELLSKDFLQNGAEAYRTAESMLNTIFELLKGKSKIIITTRKTAIFNGENFFDIINNSYSGYKILRISLSEPRINNWLSNEQIQILSTTNFPVEEVSNPVLLAFFRNSQKDDLEKMCKNNSIVEQYFLLLLNREQIRQNLKMDVNTQQNVFRNLARLMCEYDFNAENKSFIKELLLDYNNEILTKYIENYPEYPKPTFDQLADTLSNHVLLDRKKNDLIGFINDFVFGTLLGESLIGNKFEENYTSSQITDIFNEDYANLALTAFKVQPTSNKEQLWNKLNNDRFCFSDDFIFKRDIGLRNELSKKHYSDMQIEGMHFSNIIFDNDNLFENVVFNHCLFSNCLFETKAFNQSGLVNCELENCDLSRNDDDGYASMYMHLCTSDNGIEDSFYNDCEEAVSENSKNKDINTMIFECFQKPDGSFYIMKRLTAIRSSITDYDNKTINKTINKLQHLGYFHIDGDICYIQREGVAFFSKKSK